MSLCVTLATVSSSHRILGTLPDQLTHIGHIDPPVRVLLANLRRSPPPTRPRISGQNSSVTSTSLVYGCPSEAVVYSAAIPLLLIAADFPVSPTPTSPYAPERIPSRFDICPPLLVR